MGSAHWSRSLFFLLIASLFVSLATSETAIAQTAPATPNPNSEVKEPVRKTSWIAHLLRRTPDNLKLKTLEFGETQIPVLLIARPGNLRPLVEVKGKFGRPGWTLFAQNSPVAQAAGSTDFKFYAFLNGRINEVVLNAKGPNGELEEERVYLFAPEAQEFTLVSPWNSLVISAGLSSVDYTQTGFGNYLAYTGSLSARYSTFDAPTQLSYYGSLDFTAVTFASQPQQSNPQFIEARFDAAWMIPFAPNQSWKTQIIAGGFYSTMLANGSAIGFSNLIAPELGLRTRHILSPFDALISDFRIVVLSSNFDFVDRGFLASLTFSRNLINSHRMELGLNYSNTSYQATDTTRVSYGVLSLMVGYSL